MSEGITVDFGSALPYIVDSVFGLFGKDAESLRWKAKLSELVKMSAQQASMVQCVGMPQPIPIAEIYQRTTLCVPLKDQKLEFQSVLAKGVDAIILAGPGWGKTTLLHWTYSKLCASKQFVPLLFTLRWPNAVADLEELVEELQRGRDITRKKIARLVVLVDGYDEIKEPQRKKVSHALMSFRSLDIGNFYLTCRSHYHVYDLKCQHLEVGPFSREDALKFIEAYSTAYGTDVGGEALLAELEDHRLADFYAHPLMLTLVCILKSGPNQQIPRRSIGLLRRAIDTLTFRWDEAKGVHRHSTIPLDGEERVRCLMQIAFSMNSPQEPWEVIRNAAATHLSLLQLKSVNIRSLLEEMARFYGILVPVGEQYWQFVHRTIHDYLSARYWVESGGFSPSEVGEWDMHGVYAACLVADATDSMLSMLRRQRDPAVFIECLYNSPHFQAEPVAQEIILRAGGVGTIDRLGNQEPMISARQSGTGLHIETRADIYSVSSDEFLRILIAKSSDALSWATDRFPYRENMDPVADGARAVAVCAIGELLSRGAKLRSRYVSMLNVALMPMEVTHFRCVIDERELSFSLEDLDSVALD